jgi:hypothetical protein
MTMEQSTSSQQFEQRSHAAGHCRATINVR